MDFKEALTILASLAAVLGFGLTMIDRVDVEEPGDDTHLITDPPQIVILARTEFNDSGNAYAESFDGEIIRLNKSVRVVYLWSA
jgi:hypothetical protein